jgi:hypothetical protein
LIDFVYKAQSPVYTDTSIDSMVASLKEFHDHKQAILDAGARQGMKGMIDHFLIQWMADVTKHLLITH